MIFTWLYGLGTWWSDPIWLGNWHNWINKLWVTDITESISFSLKHLLAEWTESVNKWLDWLQKRVPLLNDYETWLNDVVTWINDYETWLNGHLNYLLDYETDWMTNWVTWMNDYATWLNNQLNYLSGYEAWLNDWVPWINDLENWLHPRWVTWANDFNTWLNDVIKWLTSLNHLLTWRSGLSYPLTKFRACALNHTTVTLPQKPLDVTNHSVAREVVTFFTLPPGDYIVVPQTAIPNCDGKFLLRILTDEQSNIWWELRALWCDGPRWDRRDL